MSTTMSAAEERWGGLNAVELGLVIGACGVGVLIIILVITVCCVSCAKSKKKSAQKSQHRGMVNMQTSRTVNGQNMQQVIIKNHPSEKQKTDNQNNIPYRTMDEETRTVRYDTDEEADSGTGESPTRISADMHGEDNQAFTGNTESNAQPQEEVAPYGYYVPPPPASMPPPLTPGTPVTDLDAEDDPLPPPPPKEDYTYASVNKDRNSSSRDVPPPPAPAPPSPPSSAAPSPPPPARDDSSSSDYMRQAYRSGNEIQIIEKAKF